MLTAGLFAHEIGAVEQNGGVRGNTLNQMRDIHCRPFSLQVAHGDGDISHGAWWQIHTLLTFSSFPLYLSSVLHSLLFYILGKSTRHFYVTYKCLM